jgi:SAM-dependent methyltransferase
VPEPPAGRHATRQRLLARLGLAPSISTLIRRALDAAISDADRRSPGGVAVLDAGCGHRSPLSRDRSRVARLVGVDLHAPATPLAYLDEFSIVDLCRPDTSLGREEFDVVLSTFTVEHLVDPPSAFVNMHRWLRPGGTLVLTTVNRRHPFVAAYLGLPQRVRRRLQRVLKASAADAHPLVGRCNDPASIRSALDRAGFRDVRITTVANLARGWGRHVATFALGLGGDLLAEGTPSRRSTILVVARRPEPRAVESPETRC